MVHLKRRLQCSRIQLPLEAAEPAIKMKKKSGLSSRRQIGTWPTTRANHLGNKSLGSKREKTLEWGLKAEKRQPKDLGKGMIEPRPGFWRPFKGMTLSRRSSIILGRLFLSPMMRLISLKWRISIPWWSWITRIWSLRSILRTLNIWVTGLMIRIENFWQRDYLTCSRIRGLPPLNSFMSRGSRKLRRARNMSSRIKLNQSWW